MVQVCRVGPGRAARFGLGRRRDRDLWQGRLGVLFAGRRGNCDVREKVWSAIVDAGGIRHGF